MRSPALSGLVNSCLNPVPQNIAFEFRKHGQHACKSPTARGGEIERFAQRNETHVESRQFLKRVDKVYERPPPAIQAPDDDRINLSTPGRFDQLSRKGRVVAPEPTSFTSMATVQPLFLA